MLMFNQRQNIDGGIIDPNRPGFGGDGGSSGNGDTSSGGLSGGF